MNADAKRPGHFPAPRFPTPAPGGLTPGWIAAAVSVAAVAAALMAPAAVAAQEATGDPGDAPDAVEEEAPLVDAPFQFRVGPTVGSVAWEESAAEGAQRLDDAVMWGLDVASVVGRYAGFRLGGAVGPLEMGSGGTEIDAVQYLVDVAVEGRLAVGPLHDAGVVPYVTVGGGAAIHDPEPDSLITRSQSTFTWGAGVEARILERLGARAEWRRVQSEIQPILEPTERSGRTRFAHRLFVGAYWVF